MNNTTSSVKPGIQVLTYKDESDRLGPAMEIMMIFGHYLIAFPIFLLCWFTVITFLKRRGHISNGEAQTMLEGIRSIPMPKTPNVMLASGTNRI